MLHVLKVVAKSVLQLLGGFVCLFVCLKIICILCAVAQQIMGVALPRLKPMEGPFTCTQLANRDLKSEQAC